MMNFHWPPGLKSKISNVFEKPFGPHHEARTLAEAKAAYTSAGG
jgi:hypothetical protein